ncbi:MAG: BglII/BstYI family type II restriction endonuclease [Acidobacteriota bacterium]
MDFFTDSFRWGLEHLSEEDEVWLELKALIDSITRDEIVELKRDSFKRWREGKRKSPIVGGQAILNEVIERKFKSLGWESQIFVLDIAKEEISSLTGKVSKSEGAEEEESEGSEKITYWTMDFKKGNIGVEVSFNNAGVLAQNLLRLSVMSESYLKPKEKKIRLGILITATESLKRWSNMDSTVLTFETVKRVFPLINFNIPTPIVLIGLNNSSCEVIWKDTGLFGHKKLQSYSGLSDSEKIGWDKLIDS